MSAARARVLGAIRRALERGAAEEASAQATVDARLAAAARGPVPARARGAQADRANFFAEMAREQAATVARVASAAAVPEAVAEYLRRNNLPPQIRMAPDPALEALPWGAQALLEIATGRAEGDDQVSVTGALAGVAETGTLVLASRPESPVTLNFLPDTHIVVLRASQIVGAYEDAWARLRETCGKGALPRTVNLITGPSRTADIEQTIQLGAHGPRRLHIVLIDDAAGAEDARDAG